ncbi:hypothetical protein LY76DRAFT_217887 [Colletotrichum caudatum]|nr:hypothetical protein LY76DRAFT_217887 [Colletotrichum caudatum]
MSAVDLPFFFIFILVFSRACKCVCPSCPLLLHRIGVQWLQTRNQGRRPCHILDVGTLLPALPRCTHHVPPLACHSASSPFFFSLSFFLSLGLSPSLSHSFPHFSLSPFTSSSTPSSVLSRARPVHFPKVKQQEGGCKKKKRDHFAPGLKSLLSLYILTEVY